MAHEAKEKAESQAFLSALNFFTNCTAKEG